MVRQWHLVMVEKAYPCVGNSVSSRARLSPRLERQTGGSSGKLFPFSDYKKSCVTPKAFLAEVPEGLSSFSHCDTTTTDAALFNEGNEFCEGSFQACRNLHAVASKHV